MRKTKAPAALPALESQKCAGAQNDATNAPMAIMTMIAATTLAISIGWMIGAPLPRAISGGTAPGSGSPVGMSSVTCLDDMVTFAFHPLHLGSLLTFEERESRCCRSRRHRVQIWSVRNLYS